MVSPTDASQPRLGIVAVTVGVAAVALAHAVYVFVGYRSRVVADSWMASSDFVLFALPTLLAFATYYAMLRGRAVQPVPRMITALVLMALSFSLSLLVPFNTYGT